MSKPRLPVAEPGPPEDEPEGRPGGTRREFLVRTGAGAAILATTALGIRCDGSNGNSEHDGTVDKVSQAAPDSTIAVDGYFMARFGVSLGSIYWGDLHTHSNYSYDGTMCGENRGPVESCEFARDPQGSDLDFVALTDHAENPPEDRTPPEDANLNLWESLIRICGEQTNEDPGAGKPFIVFPAWEYTNTYGLRPLFGSVRGYGHKCVILKSPDQVPVTRAASWRTGPGSEVYARTASDLWAHLDQHRPSSSGAEGTALTIPHTPSMVGGSSVSDHQTDWSAMDKDFVRQVEIYSKWGNSEGPSPPEGCAQDDTDLLLDYDSERQDEGKTLRVLLHQRWILDGNGLFRMGFVGGTDNHVGQPGNDLEGQCGKALEYRGAVTGIVASALDRNALWSGLWARHTLAGTTGSIKMPVLFAVETGGAHLLMGDSGSHDGQARVRVLADSAISTLNLIVDGCLDRTVTGHWLDESLTLPAGRHYIYVRAVRTTGDGEPAHAWTSPVYLA